MTKMKTYRTLFVEIGDNIYRFPYSSDEKADAAFDGWVAKAKEVLGDRITTFSDHSWDYQRADGKTNYVKDLFMTVDGSTHIDVSVQDYDWDAVTAPLDQEMEELEKKNQEWIETKIKEAIKSLADDFYINPREEVYKSDLLDEVKECAYGVYGIYSEEVSEFNKNHSIVAIYCNYLVDAGEIADWEWDGPNRNYAKLALSE